MLSRFRDSLYIIYQILSFVKRFSESFLKKFSSKNGVQAVGKGSSGCRRGLGSRDSLIIIASSMTFVNRFLQVFLFFRQSLRVKFGQGVYWGDGGWRAQIMGGVGGKRVAGSGVLREWVNGGRLTAGGGEVAGRACPAPTGGERKIVGVRRGV